MSSPALARILLRPYALARQALELPVAAVCILMLFLVFIGDISTPIQVAVSALGLLPLLTAIWLLSGRLALLVSSVAVGQLLLSGFLGSLSPITVASEATAYVVLAVVCRLLADGVSHFLVGALRTGKLPLSSPSSSSRLPTMVRRRRSDLTIASLTNREREVARLAAEGYTAREIGYQLHIGKRTVETHLANAYEKLGVRSKRELMHSGTAGAVGPIVDA